MQSLTLETHVGADGILHLDLPVALRNTDLKVTVVLLQRVEANRAVNAVKKGLKAKFARLPEKLSLADELISERRDEARREMSS
ncbi:MAG: AbrB family transcriptional regulator [Gammaproteobacteria bacterium]|nr:AbrB family transcriptional regulator [Gammaproteobacteria bacterium]